MKKIIILLLIIPILSISQEKNEVKKYIEEVESYLQKLNYYYDDIYVNFHQKKKKITNPINKLNNEIKKLNSSFKNEEKYFDAYEELAMLTTSDCNSCSFTYLDSLSEKNILFGIKLNYFNKIKKLDLENADLKLVSENNYSISIRYENNQVLISKKKIDKKKSDKIIKSLKKNDYNFNSVDDNQLIKITKSRKAVDIKNSINKINKEIRVLKLELNDFDEKVIYDAQDNDEKILKEWLSYYNDYLKNIRSNRRKNVPLNKFTFEWTMKSN